MMYLIQGMPDNVLAVSATGVVTDEDYRKTLIPAAEAKLKSHGKIRVLYHLGPGFESFEVKAMADDAAFGLKHRREFERIAMVTDNELMRKVVRMFAFMVPCPVAVYDNAKMNEAERWVSAPG